MLLDEIIWLKICNDFRSHNEVLMLIVFQFLINIWSQRKIYIFKNNLIKFSNYQKHITSQYET